MEKKYIPYLYTKDKDVPYLESISFGKAGLEIYCDFKESRKKIVFEYCLSYRLIEEGNALITLEAQDFSGEAWMFFTNKSDFINWFDKESYQIYEGKFVHYIVVFQGYIIDILSEEKPYISASKLG